MTPTRIPLRFDAAYALLSRVLFLSPADSYLDVGADEVHVRMAWAFRATFPRASIASAHVSHDAPISRGVHGFGGRWLVNGAGDRIAAIDLHPEARAHTMGFPIRLRQLMVSVDDPAGLCALLSGRPSPGG